MQDNEAQPKKVIIWDILEILKQTEAGNGLTVKDIQRLLATYYEAKGMKTPTDKTILADLRILQQYSKYLVRPVMPPDPEAYKKLPHDRQIRCGWYLGIPTDENHDDAQYVSDTQICILADAIRSLPVDYETRNDLLYTLQELVNHKATISIQKIDRPTFTSKRLLNGESFSIISDISKAIELGDSTVTFNYCDYDERGRLVARSEAQKPKIYEVLPYRMTYKTGLYYLFGDLISVNGEFQKESSIRTFVIQRITKLKALEHSVESLSKSRLAMARKFDVEQYLRNIPYAYHEKVETLSLDVSLKGLNSFFEWFDEADSVRKDPRTGRYIVEFRSAPTPVSWWVMQFSNNGNVRIRKNGTLIRLVAKNCEALYRDLRNLQNQVKHRSDVS